MPEFLTLKSPDEARALLAGFGAVGTEVVALESADDRVVASPVRAPEALPPWPRATMDGYAVRAADTFGASEAVPAYLTVIGESPMGSAPTRSVDRGQALI